jgi:hypothetical protein
MTKSTAAVAAYLTLAVTMAGLATPTLSLDRAKRMARQDHSQHHADARPITEVNFDKYRATLRVPPEGVYAGEEIDIEFRVVDTTAQDEIEEGFRGVGGITATAVVTMPSMPGMPAARPKVHREGVPGDYGIELFFPHGGDYRIELTLAMPDAKEHKIAFVIPVGDERPATTNTTAPYRLEVMDWPAQAKAGEPTQLRLGVIETESGDIQRDFDIAHEKPFHLLIASQDLNWFIHEHPEMNDEGIWEIPITFPAGGKYWVYGDVAPRDQGSRVLIAQVEVAGPAPTWDTALTLSRKSEDRGLAAELVSEAEIPVGRSTELEIRLTDAASGQPATDTVKWLGAAGHMMIFHQDGQTVVHSHPAEDEASEALVRQGVVRFQARFPKPGLYKVYGQFDWRGSIRTLPFVVEVKP